MKKEVLPIGSVVMLEGGTKPLMVSGYKMKDADNLESDKYYDYVGCIFPEGFMERIYSLFDHDQISDVLFVGFKDDDYKRVADQVRGDVVVGSGTGLTADASNRPAKKRGRTPKAPTKPRSKSEMLRKYGVVKEATLDPEAGGVR